MFLAYDRDFRKLRAHNNMPWNVLHQELFFSLTSRADNVPSVQQKMAFPRRKQPFRAGLFYAFGSTGRCWKPHCPCKHACPSCGGNHPKSHTVKQNKRCIQSPSLPTSVIVNNLALLLRESRYDRDSIHDLTQGFTCGFRNQFQSSLPHTIQPRNHPSMLDKSSVVDRMIVSELTLGRIAAPFSATACTL